MLLSLPKVFQKPPFFCLAFRSNAVDETNVNKLPEESDPSRTR